MNEEKPTFKVTDRRLFNSDGSPREIERQAETPAATTSAPVEATSEAKTGSASLSSAAAVGAGTATTREAESAATKTAAASLPPPPPAPPVSEARTPAAAPPEGDPTPFANLIMFIASPAAAAMGMTEHPGLGEEIDLQLAKHCIDLLGTIQQKTRGNLGAQETQLLEGLLAELRMQFVSMTSAPPRPAPGGGGPRGFTGGDIIGGK